MNPDTLNTPDTPDTPNGTNTNDALLRYFKDVGVEEEGFHLFIFTQTPLVEASSPPGQGTQSAASNDIRHFSLGDWSGDISDSEKKIKDVEKSLEIFYNDIESNELGVDNWMQLCKIVVDNTGYPQSLNQYVLKSENILYEDKFSTKLKEKYKANVIYQMFFNLVRFHVHSNEGNFNVAQEIIHDLYNNWTNIDLQYQPAIIYYKFVFSICTGDFPTAIDAMTRFHALLRMVDEATRHSFGIWDDWVSILIIVWYVCSKSIVFERQFMNFMKIRGVFYQSKRKKYILGNFNGMKDILTEPYFKKLNEVLANIHQ